MLTKAYIIRQQSGLKRKRKKGVKEETGDEKAFQTHGTFCDDRCRNVCAGKRNRLRSARYDWHMGERDGGGGVIITQQVPSALAGLRLHPAGII